MLKQTWLDRQRIRNEAGLTQAEVAGMLGISQQHFCRIENGGIATPKLYPLGINYLEILIGMEANNNYESRRKS